MNILAAALCVFLFSLTVPFTRMAASEATPELIIVIRLLGASIICGLFVLYDGWRPPKSAYPALFRTALGSVIGFSSLTAFAMKEVPGGHGAVGLAALPVVTAAYASLRDRFNPGLKFWLFAFIGSFLSFSFFFLEEVSEVLQGDLLLILAVFAAAFGYVEGGRLSREHGGTRVMSWAILVTMPLIIPVSIYLFMDSGVQMESFGMNTWLAMVYLALVSQSTGMFLWFKVLAKGPMEKIAMVQLLQPFFTLLASIILLGEHVSSMTWVIAFLVALCIFGANKERTSSLKAHKS